jgi:hypothetical protein
VPEAKVLALLGRGENRTTVTCEHIDLSPVSAGLLYAPSVASAILRRDGDDRSCPARATEKRR